MLKAFYIFVTARAMNRRGGRRPNRGGGRGGGGAQPRSKGVARKGADFDDEDYQDLLNGDSLDEEDSEDDEWILDDDEDEDQAKAVGGDKPAPTSERRKVEMQILHMSDQSQQSVIQMLKEIYGSGYILRDASNYKDAGQRIDRRFWIQDKLRVTNVMNFAASAEEQEPDDEIMDEFAIKKLESYGFHRSRCIEALKNANFGQAFETLMCDLFQLSFEKSDHIQAEDDPIEDEKVAIQSIYGEEALKEKIPGKLWELKLELPSLMEVVIPKNDQKNSRRSNAVTRQMLEKDPNVCQFFLRGHCKFGKRCYRKHVTPDKDEIIDDKHLKELDSEDEKGFFMEVRFPDKCQYPQDPPLVCFYTPMKKVPRQVCLKITARLMHEAKQLAQDHCPSVFSLISLLENTDEMKKAVQGQDVSFSFAVGLEPEVQKETKISGQDRLLSSLGISINTSGGGGNNLATSGGKKFERNKSLKNDDNAKIIERFKKKTINEKMMETRKSLPAWSEQEAILTALSQHQVLVISGMTGCGKSTQGKLIVTRLGVSFISKGVKI